MPHRKLVQIGHEPKLPTVADYFRDLAQRQGEDIRLLKQRAQELADARAVRSARQKSIREESWRLHPLAAPGTASARKASSKKRTVTAGKKKKAASRKRR